MAGSARESFGADVVEALHEAFDSLGGREWLIKLALEDPKIFAQMLMRTIPKESHATLDVTTVDLSSALAAAERRTQVIEHDATAATRKLPRARGDTDDGGARVKMTESPPGDTDDGGARVKMTESGDSGGPERGVGGAQAVEKPRTRPPAGPPADPPPQDTQEVPKRRQFAPSGRRRR